MRHSNYQSDGPLYFILNTGSGRGDKPEAQELLERMMQSAGRSYHLCLVEQPSQLEAVAQDAVAQANAHGGAVVVVGGDGTINAVANIALMKGCVFGVVPQGTFNYFGRTHDIPEDLGEAIRQLLRATPQPVQVGLLNEHIFLVNASLGLYRQVLEDREDYKQRYGRARWVAAWSGVATIVHGFRQLRIRLEQAGETADLRTPTLFVANNRLQLAQAGMPEVDTVESGQLVAVTIKPVGTLALLWLLLRGALGQLGDAENINSFGFRSLTVTSPPGRRVRALKVAMDGEVMWMKPPLTFKVSPQPLYLLKASPLQPDDKPESVAKDRRM